MGKIADLFRSQNIVVAEQTKRQMLSLDQEFSTMEAKIKTLEADNLKLQAQVNPLEREVQRLKEQIQQKATPPKAPVHALEPTEIEILKVLASAKYMELVGICSVLNLNQHRAEHYLDVLIGHEYVWRALSMIAPARYSLSEKGRAYAVKEGFV